MQEILRELAALRRDVARLQALEAGALISSGTAFPSAPQDNQLYRRTDRDLLYSYDSALGLWLTLSEYQATPTWLWSAAAPVTANGSILIFPARTDYGARVTRAAAYVYVSTTNNGTNYWTIDVAYGGTAIWAFNTSADAANTNLSKETSSGTTVASPTLPSIINASKTGAPGSLLINMAVWYRLVG